MRAVITVTGKDRTGIIAKISATLYEHQVNIVDISQNVMEDMFAMVMLVNMTACMCVRQRDVLTLLLRAVHGHGELRAADAALFGAHGRGDNAGDAQRIELLQKCLRLRQQLEQRRREHIARGAHAAVKIQCFHGLAPI